jgi:membrane protein implicated in regulation of membrane protease activity
MEFFLIHLPWFWLGISIILIIVEVITTKLSAVWFAAGAVAALFSSMIPGLTIMWQIIIFLAATFLLWMTVRKAAINMIKNHKYRDSAEKNSLIMQDVTAVTEITETNGEAKDCNGAIHQARSDDGTTIPEGSVCTVTSEDRGILKVFATRNI